MTMWKLIWTVGICALMLGSCVRPAHQTEAGRMADSLNALSYESRYKSLDRSEQLAEEAWREAEKGTPSQRAEALNNRAFCAFMRMDFERAAALYRQASEASRNEVERLVADVGQMKICQRTSMNKDFYDWRNSALRRIRRINEDKALLDGAHLRKRMNYALSEFYIVSGIYYYYLEQDREALASIDSIPSDALRGDRGQWLYYMYMRGSGGMYQAPTREEVVEGEFSYLVECLQVSAHDGFVYFEANALQAMAELLNFRSNRELLERERPGLLRMVNPEGLPADSLPLRFAHRALELFKQYGDWYQISGTYRTIATYYNYAGQSEKALPNLKSALEYVNLHHETFYHCSDTTDRLRAYVPGATSSVELKWINEEGIRTVPEWVARLREQLSRSYSALGMKAESDYNRNVYLDILDYTRQDKELESRFLALEQEERQLDVLLFMVVGGLVVSVCVFVLLNRYWRRRNAVYVAELKRMLLLCQRVIGAVPVEATTQKEVADAVCGAVRDDLREAFHASDVWIELGTEEREDRPENEGRVTQSFALVPPGKEEEVGRLWLVLSSPFRKEERAMFGLLLPYLAWTLENGLNLVSLDDERKQLEKEQYIHRQHLAENKCQNEVKKACLSIVTGILPFIDRVANETGKLRSPSSDISEDTRERKLEYIGELTDRINEYNDILALWIKMRQGTLSLKVENFALQELFRMVARGRRAFEARHQRLTVEDTGAVVKADKALTLFMISTLTENARKYTQDGGHIRLSAAETGDYVEISVADDGPGLSDKDIRRILDEKVYDSSAIGMDTAADAALLHRQKGHGFGLMNCKGIIEKYRKTNKVFGVCLFNIESTVGKGSRFYFRLPKGVARVLLMVGVAWTLVLGGCASGQAPAVPSGEDSLRVSRYDSLLAVANDYANWVYECNVNGDYATALELADSVMHYMNMHYLRYSGKDSPLLALYGRDEAAELAWLSDRFDTDYFILLDVRNEAAVASLALKDFRKYRYNNAAYASLYKRLSRDNSLEAYCLQMQQSAANKRIALSFLILTVLGCLVAYYVLYLRRRLRYRYNIEQVFAVNRAIFSASLHPDDTDLRVVQAMFREVNEIVPLANLALAVENEQTHALKLSCCRGTDEEGWEDYIRRCCESRLLKWSDGPGWSSLPLWVEAGGEKRCVGMLALQTARSHTREEDRLLVELVCNYLAAVLYHTIVQVDRKCHDIELAHDEARRTLFEENQLHVQNMVLDNCLSAIKHETVYYPNRIRQLAARLNGAEPDERKEILDDMAELVGYYRDIFSLLTSCAVRQLDEVTFRRSGVDMKALAGDMKKYLDRLMRKKNFSLELEVEAEPLFALGDAVLLRFLLESLTDEAVRTEESGALKLTVRRDGDFVRVDFIDCRRTKSVEELNALFYPDKRRMCAADNGQTLTGTEYLVCRQIIRDHDEFGGKRGCRINACPAAGGGFDVWFTVPFRRRADG